MCSKWTRSKLYSASCSSISDILRTDSVSALQITLFYVLCFYFSFSAVTSKNRDLGICRRTSRVCTAVNNKHFVVILTESPLFDVIRNVVLLELSNSNGKMSDSKIDMITAGVRRKFCESPLDRES